MIAFFKIYNIIATTPDNSCLCRSMSGGPINEKNSNTETHTHKVCEVRIITVQMYSLSALAHTSAGCSLVLMTEVNASLSAF